MFGINPALHSHRTKKRCCQKHRSSNSFSPRETIYLSFNSVSCNVADKTSGLLFFTEENRAGVDSRQANEFSLRFTIMQI